MQSVIKKVVSLRAGNKKYSSCEFLDSYIKSFYSNCHSKDFFGYSDQELFDLAASSFDFFKNRKSGDVKIRLYNPVKKKDGFETSYTILDIVNDDMPFLVDSTIIQFDKANIEIKNIIHPILSGIRSKKGDLEGFSNADNAGSESVIQFHLAYISNEEIKEIEDQLRKILSSVAVVVDDWKAMTDIANIARDQIDNANNASADPKEVKEFINWILDGSFIFLGSAEYNIEEKNGEYSLKSISKSRLGVYKSEYEDIKPNILNCSSKEISDSIKKPYIIEILKSRYKSQIHRGVNTERVRVQKFDKNGNVVGEYRFVGLFTSSVYYQSANLIPIIRKKINRIILESGFKASSHNLKDLVTTLESYPRDELFQIDCDDLFRISMGIVAIAGRSILRFFPRHDKFNRFVSCLIFIPRDNFNTALKDKIKEILTEEYNGEVTDVYTQITDSRLTRLHIIVRTDNGIPNVDQIELENRLIEAARLWSENLKYELLDNFDRQEAKELFKTYKSAFSLSYTSRFSAKNAVLDTKYINKALESNRVICDLYQSSNVDVGVVELKIYSPSKNLTLSDIMPILSNFGFSVIHEHTYLIEPDKKDVVWCYYFNLNLSKHSAGFSKDIEEKFEEAIGKIWQNETGSGYLDHLVTAANLSYRQVFLLRAYVRYLYQIGFHYSQKHTSDILVQYSHIAELIVKFFETKFDPNFKGDRKSAVAKTHAAISKELNNITNSIDDYLIRKLANVVEATIRTNFFQKTADGEFKRYVSFKFDCSKVNDLPLPAPHAEIYVFSTDVEGVHLRGGKVARGGLRWSDRREDFRTEVLGLMKAQMTKNSVIVPVGSKGGFVVKKDTSFMNRDEFLQTGIECYKTFLSGLLDITDNVVKGKISYPDNVVRYDGDDPYLVVAADKGTATFSDIANGLAQEYGFWLGDAFASGGSVGYDHKKMGITARGAWVSVKRHFSEIGIDTQSQDFTCVGIGDMSGDVFGNGMLLSKHICLVAAFNHMHIFLDPNPDSAISFKERKRMFNLPRSSWMDYNQKLISKGGGVFERSAKSIKISKEVKELLAIDDDELTPNKLISAILKAPIDLIWNGGVGTYVKASSESHLEVGDKVNDVLRVNADELRCKVIGEGGNLGLTQKGRIEYAANGGAVNTDAIDNSAGVDCSDNEVNIKIALAEAVSSGKISLSERNKILESMTDNVAEHVLTDNRLQTQILTIENSKGHLALGDQAQFLKMMERSGLLNSKVEFLPNEKEIAKRQYEKKGMTRPELSVMLSYSKMDLYAKILDSGLTKDKYFQSYLHNYFPVQLQEKFAKEIDSHRLRDEVIATVICNKIVNRVGITLMRQIAHDNGVAVNDVIKNCIIVCDSFDLDKVWQNIESLDGKVDHKVQVRMFLAINKLLERSILWLLRNHKSKDIQSSINEFKSTISELCHILYNILADASRESYDRKVAEYLESKVPNNLVHKIASMDPLASAYDIIEISNKSKFDIKTAGQIYFEVGTRLHLKWLRSRVSGANIDNYWQKLSSKTILEDLYNYQMRIAQQVVDFSCKNKDFCPTGPSLDSWIDNVSLLVDRYDLFISDLRSQVNPDLSVFVVALNRIKALVNL
ncbi:MAG: NAD-glutamate dehydrogenase [Proteobacteria bacterium]|nr:NAD-glutamate dehydrogenase [Pseudomonadota bacterium]